MAEHGIGNIDLVIVNLYAFEATVAKGSNFETCIENIDIGAGLPWRGVGRPRSQVFSSVWWAR